MYVYYVVQCDISPMHKQSWLCVAHLTFFLMTWNAPEQRASFTTKSVFLNDKTVICP